MTSATTFSLTSFLRLCQMDTGQRIVAIDRKLNPGASYNFYHTLTRAIRAYLEGKSTDVVDDILRSPSNAVEREYNLAAYKVFADRYANRRTVEVVKQPRVYSIPGYNIFVSCDPLFSTIENGSKWVHAIWATRSPQLQRKYTALGCLILRDCYRNTALANSTFAIANLTDGKRTGEKSVSNATSAILRSDANTVAQMIADAS